MSASAANGSQLKGPTVLSAPVRGSAVASALGKQQIITRTPSSNSGISTLRPTILHSAITINQGQIHPFKQTSGSSGIQAIGSAVTLTPVLPTRTQTIVYTGGSTTFSTTPRVTVTCTVPTQRTITAPRTVGQVTTTRLSMPVNVSQSGAKLVAHPGAVLTSGTRLSAIPSSQPAILGTTQNRISTSQQNVSIGRLPVATVTPAGTPNILGQTKIALHPLLVANNSRTIQTQAAKIITNPQNQGTAIHLTQLPIKTSQNVVVTTASRTSK